MNKEVQSLLTAHSNANDKVIMILCDKINLLELEGLRRDRKMKDLEKVVSNLVHNMQGFTSEFEDVKSHIDKDLQDERAELRAEREKLLHDLELQEKKMKIELEKEIKLEIKQAGLQQTATM